MCVLRRAVSRHVPTLCVCLCLCPCLCVCVFTLLTRFLSPRILQAGKSIEQPAGPMPQFQHTMEPMLRTKLQMPVELRRGVITLLV
eukprot:COSAG05_NODE_6803_length_900_cov_1.647940_3_plen_85_part_01